MAITCERCGARSSSMICTNCGYVNFDPAEEERLANGGGLDGGNEKKKGANLLTFGEAMKVKRKWRWTNVFGYLHTLSIVIFCACTAFMSLITGAYALLSLLVSLISKDPKNVVTILIAKLFSPAFAFFNIKGPIFLDYVMPALLTSLVICIVVGIYFLAIVKNVSCVGLSFYLKKRKISLENSYAGEDTTKSAVFLQDAFIMKDRPLCIILYFARTLGELLFVPSLVLFASYIFFLSGQFLRGILMEIYKFIDLPVLIPFLMIVAFIISAIFVAIPLIVFKKVMGMVFDNKVYKD